MINEIFFDVETQKLFDDINGNDPKDLGLSIVSTYQRTLDENFNEVEGKIKSFWQEELENLWPIFQNADRIIGFNSIKFDVPVLQPYTTLPLSKLNHFDIMQKVKEAFGRRLSLNALAKETLNQKKTDIGTNAVIYWQKKDKESLKKLKKYCEDDVIITRNLYDYVLKNKHLKFRDKWNTPRTIDLDFSYPKEDSDNIKQGGLF